MSIIQLTQTIHILPSLPGRQQKHFSQPALPGLESELETRPQVTNRQVAEVLSSIADLLQYQNGNPYRVQAYRNAARGILDLPEPVTAFIARGEMLPIPGLGQRLRARILELVETGTMTFYNDLSMQTLPAGARSLLAVEHVGIRTAIQLYETLGIDSVASLYHAAQQGRIRHLPGFGQRSETRLKEAARALLQRREPASLGGAA
jgi:DNA polymerase (family 10)